jgi:hypothetical protein
MPRLETGSTTYLGVPTAEAVAERFLPPIPRSFKLDRL